MTKKRVIIMGAAGRDFHNFNTFYRDNKDYEVVAFTATQIPDIEGRVYPKELAGKLYPKGVPIYAEEEIVDLIVANKVDEVVFAYSDVPYEYVMDKAALVNAAGADFKLMGLKNTILRSKLPVIAICAGRTGSGKSQTTRRVAEILDDLGKKVAVIRHPMPYGDLKKQVCQKYKTMKDMDKYNCTIEEREEYEPHLMQGRTLFAGVDYGKILKEAEKIAEVILWDGGNNDLPFYFPDLHITVVDPHRAGDELTYYPGETNLLISDVIIVNKVSTADYEKVLEVERNCRAVNQEAIIVEAASPIAVKNPERIAGKRVVVVEDGPTLTHGEMKFGAGVVAALKFGAAEIIDPKPFAVNTIAETYEKYPDISNVIPAMGYSKKQVKDLEKTINACDAELVIIGTPIDLLKLIKISKPSVRVSYDLQVIGEPNLRSIISNFIKTYKTK
ncbi:GTPase [bacterium]|nr:GTPase [bacterium]